MTLAHVVACNVFTQSLAHHTPAAAFALVPRTFGPLFISVHMSAIRVQRCAFAAGVQVAVVLSVCPLGDARSGPTAFSRLPFRTPENSEEPCVILGHARSPQDLHPRASLAEAMWGRYRLHRTAPVSAL